MTEMWRPIPGYEGYYEASDQGQIRSLGPMARVLKPAPDRHGYLRVALSRDGRPRTRLVHQLVIAAFTGPRPEGLEVRHLNGENNDNRPENLAYGTHAENVQDAVAHGTHYTAGRDKTHCKRGHEFDEANTRIDSRGRRSCRTCDREKHRRQKAARPARTCSCPNGRCLTCRSAS